MKLNFDILYDSFSEIYSLRRYGTVREKENALTIRGSSSPMRSFGPQTWIFLRKSFRNRASMPGRTAGMAGA